VLLALSGGLVLHAVAWPLARDTLWVLATLGVLGPSAWTSLRALLQGNTGVDLVAVLAMTSALLLGEPLAAVLVALMLAGGEALEALAQARARSALHAHAPLAPSSVAAVRRMQASHAGMTGDLEDLGRVAAALEGISPGEAMAALAAVYGRLVDQVLVHQREEETDAFPRLAEALPGQDPVAPLEQTHREVRRRIRLLGRMVDGMGGGEEGGLENLHAVQHQLVGLQAILRLHRSQEEELFALAGGQNLP
jgi:hypothetical protein